jgi:hypothetical protein
MRIIQALDTGQATTLLSPAGQAIGNIQAELSEETIIGAWKVRNLRRLCCRALIIAGIVQWRDPQHPHASCREGLFTCTPYDIDTCGEACEDGACHSRAHCTLGFECRAPHRFPVPVASAMEHRKPRMRRHRESCLWCTLAAQTNQM